MTTSLSTRAMVEDCKLFRSTAPFFRR